MDSELDFDACDDRSTIPTLCRYLSERSPQPMVAVDGLTHIVSYVNPAFAQLVGRKIKELVGRPFAEAVPEGTENGCLKMLDRVFRTGRTEYLADQEHLELVPRPTYWSYTMWAILGAELHPVGVMIQVTNTTETAIFRQQSVAINESLLISATKQHELTQIAEALSAKLQAAVQMRDRFIAVMSHELRNPLATLSSGIELLKLAGGDATTAKNARDMMERQLKQMVHLVNDLLDVSRITTGKMELHIERVDLASVLQDAVEACREIIDQQDHRLTVTLPTDPVLLDADPARLNQVFSNLLNNAAKYSERGGAIQVSAEIDGGEVVVSVQDNGIGISAAALPHIFDAFVQVDTSWKRTQGGMGIGLSLVKEFVNLHGGRVEVKSSGVGQGTKFVVRLPMASRDVDEPNSAIEKKLSPRLQVLVVDDNKDAAQSLAMLLKFLGHEVQTAYDGEAAVAAAELYQPELILMDLGMPNVDGYEACRRIRAKPWGKKPFLIALTGWGSSDDQRRTREVGFDRHLVKPVELDAINSIVGELSINSHWRKC